MEDTLSDERIVELIQQGDKEKFGVLMERYDEKLSRYGKKFLARKESIDDIVQDIFISTYENLQSFDTSLKFSSWIYRIAHNAFVNGLRKEQRSAIPTFDLDVFVSPISYKDEKVEEREYAQMKEMIDKGLDELSPKYKEIIILHYLEGFGYKEISDILQVPTGTVGVRLKRGKEALKQIYERMQVHFEHEP